MSVYLMAFACVSLVCHYVQFNVNLWVLSVFGGQLVSTKFGIYDCII